MQSTHFFIDNYYEQDFFQLFPLINTPKTKTRIGQNNLSVNSLPHEPSLLQFRKTSPMLTDITELNSPNQPRTQRTVQTQTTQFGIQVDLNQNPQNLQNHLRCTENQLTLTNKLGPSSQQRKKQKKKQYKRKKKEHAQEMQREARRQIGNIVQQFYEGTAKFQDYADRMEHLIQLVNVNNTDFRQYLDQLIRMRYIQKAIWEYTQSILYENPFQRSEDHLFYSQMVEEIYRKYLEIEQASQQIEQVINVYLRLAYQQTDSPQEMVYSNLANNTFNYLIETDDTLKNLLHICNRKISQSKQDTRKKLQELLTIIERYQQPDDDEDQASTNCPQDEPQMVHVEEDYFAEKPKRKRRKVKESELLDNEEAIINRLQDLVIREEERVTCRVSEEWSEHISLKGVKYRCYGH